MKLLNIRYLLSFVIYFTASVYGNNVQTSNEPQDNVDFLLAIAAGDSHSDVDDSTVNQEDVAIVQADALVNVVAIRNYSQFDCSFVLHTQQGYECVFDIVQSPSVGLHIHENDTWTIKIFKQNFDKKQWFECTISGSRLLKSKSLVINAFFDEEDDFDDAGNEPMDAFFDNLDSMTVTLVSSNPHEKFFIQLQAMAMEDDVSSIPSLERVDSFGDNTI